MYLLFPNLKAEEGTAGLQEELELPEALGISLMSQWAQGRESCGEFHIDSDKPEDPTQILHVWMIYLHEQ